MKMFYRKKFVEAVRLAWIKANKMLLVYVYALVSISTMFVYSATRSERFVYQNLLWIGIGSLLLLIISFINYNYAKKYIKLIYLGSISLLLMVRFFGKKTLGAQRWLRVGPFQLQPSEFVKIAIIIIIAYWLVTKYKNGINNLIDIFLGITPVLPLIVLILLQPDLGSTLIITMAYFVMIFLYDANLKSVLIICFIVLSSIYPIYKFALTDYQKTRVLTFLNPESDVQGNGWHITQSKISVGAGGFSGTGILKGSQSRLEFLPEAQTDFIFSVISEEWGFVGSTGVILIYFLLILEIMKVSSFIHDPFGKLILYGISGIFFMHVLLNIGMTIGVLPVTGKPLLLMSYGGSSFLSSFIMIGIVESIKINVEE